MSPTSYNYLDAWGVTYDKNSNVLTGGDSHYEGAGTYTYDNLNRLSTVVSTLVWPGGISSKRLQPNSSATIVASCQRTP